MQFDTSILGNLSLILTSFAAAFLAALWLSLIIWTYRDARSRSRDVLVRILAVLVVAILFLPGLLIYVILRPQHSLEDEYQHSLEEEALLQNIEDFPACPGCSRRVQSDWVICPNCHTRLKKRCQQCGRLMELPWNLCPFCASPVPGMRLEGLSMDEALQNLDTDDSLLESSGLSQNIGLISPAEEDESEQVELPPESGNEI